MRCPAVWRRSRTSDLPMVDCGSSCRAHAGRLFRVHRIPPSALSHLSKVANRRGGILRSPGFPRLFGLLSHLSHLSHLPTGSVRTRTPYGGAPPRWDRWDRWDGALKCLSFSRPTSLAYPTSEVGFFRFSRRQPPNRQCCASAPPIAGALPRAGERGSPTPAWAAPCRLHRSGPCGARASGRASSV